MATQPIKVPVGQRFGLNPRTYARLGMNGHNGWDYPAKLNEPIYAPESGRVEQRVDPSGYGRNLYLTGDSGWNHVLAHQQSFAVGNGRVSEGQLVGYVNSTGFSTGNHLHWGTRPPRYNQNNGYYGYVDPQIFLNEQKGVSSLPYSDEQYKAVSTANHNNKVLAIQGFIQNLTSVYHTDKDVVKNHLGSEAEFNEKERNALADKFLTYNPGQKFEDQEYFNQGYIAYRDTYQPKNTPVSDEQKKQWQEEVKKKAKARVTIPQLRIELMKNK